MGRNSHYWFDHGKRSQLAKQHTKWMETHAAKQIADSSKNSVIFDNTTAVDEQLLFGLNRYPETKERLVCADTATFILKCAYKNELVGNYMHTEHNKLPKMCALNFASFKYPGGAFLKGSCAQEEMLCHESNLYNILRRWEDSYYKRNRQTEWVNRSLYQDTLIYTPNVLFMRKLEDDNYRYAHCDVITCAAPNAHAATNYHQVSQDEIEFAMKQRILGILHVACLNQVDDLILGAFGCGVFGNDPHLVASIFHEYISTVFNGCFFRVWYAVPDTRSANYQAFQKVITEKPHIKNI